MAMTSSVEQEDQTFYITFGDRHICSFLAMEDSEVRQWVYQIEKQYLNKKSKKKNKQPPLVVGLWAERSIEYYDGQRNYNPRETKLFNKIAPYELLAICVGDQCLLWVLEYRQKNHYVLKEGFIRNEMPKALKDFLSSSRIVVVGFGIDDTVKKLENETDLLIPKKMELRDVVQEKLGQIPGEFAKSSKESLVEQVMGPGWKAVKPESMEWCGSSWYDPISNELAQYVSTEAFILAEMASNLLPVEPVSQVMERRRKSSDLRIQKLMQKLEKEDIGLMLQKLKLKRERKKKEEQRSKATEAEATLGRD